MKATLFYSAFITSAFLSAATAASIRIEWSNNSGNELGDYFGNPLKPGTSADFDGSALQLGYYTLSTLAAPFAGDWVPLTGIGSNNDQLSTIGDKGNQGFGRFNISSAFITGSTLYGNDLPTNSIPLSIRFYDSLSPSGSAHFNAASNTSGAWNWITPSDPQAVVTISLSDAGILWQGGTGSAYQTTINVVPEPTTVALLLFGIGLFVCSRKHHPR